MITSLMSSFVYLTIPFAFQRNTTHERLMPQELTESLFSIWLLGVLHPFDDATGKCVVTWRRKPDLDVWVEMLSGDHGLGRGVGYLSDGFVEVEGCDRGDPVVELRVGVGVSGTVTRVESDLCSSNAAMSSSASMRARIFCPRAATAFSIRTGLPSALAESTLNLASSTAFWAFVRATDRSRRDFPSGASAYKHGAKVAAFQI